MKRCDLRAQILEKEVLPDENFTREKWIIQTEEDIWMPFYLLKPKQTFAEKNPVIIATHGHGSGGKLSTAGVWDLMRLVDYIKTRPDCNGDKIGCIGLSGGGLQSLWLAALDDRIMFATVSGYFYGYRDSLLEMNQNCCCNYVPGLWEHVDMGDIGALIAPRALVIESGMQDHLNGRRGIVNVLEQVAAYCPRMKKNRRNG